MDSEVACEDTPACNKDIIFCLGTLRWFHERLSFVDRSVSIPENQPGRYEASNMRSDIFSGWTGHGNFEGPIPGTKPKAHSWEAASENVVRNTIRSLTEDKDMERSYVSVLSTINELGCRFDGDDSSNASPATKADQLAPRSTKLLMILTRDDIVQALFQETRRQGVAAPHTLYFQLYHVPASARTTSRRGSLYLYQ